MSKTLENIEGYLFPEYSKRKLHCLSETYGELAKLYRNIPQESIENGSRRDYLHQRQMKESKQLFAKHLEEISGAVGDVADTVMHVSVPVEHKKKALIHHLKSQGIIVKELVFLEQQQGKRRISLVARLAGRKQITTEELAGFLSVFFNRRLMCSFDSATVLKRSFDTFVFEDEPHYTVMTAMSRAVMEDEKISGDNYSVQEYSEDLVTLMIADGMGSGEKACRDSESVIEFMEKFMEAGFPKEKAFTMVNAAIASQTQCCDLTTLDMCEVDLNTGEAQFLKAGAASSFRKRGCAVDEISSDTLPLGSLMDICPMTQSISIAEGDMLIMMSDGVADCFENSNGYSSIRDIIAGHDTSNPKELSDYLLKCAINCQGGHIRDDMTILVAGFWNVT